jgi:hypothetical protein
MRKIPSYALAFAAPLLASCAAKPPANLFCEQLAEVAVVTERLRNESMPLADVMREADRLEQSKRFTEAEIARIRETIEKTFNSVRSPNEILLDCRMNSKK